MKIVVCGGAGFLGAYLTEALLREGHDVTVYDLKEKTDPQLKCKWVVGSILDRSKLEKAVKGADFVYNMVAISGISDCIKHPVEAVELNVLGNMILLDVCMKAKIKRFILASTVYVYSSSGGVYRSTKQAAELLVEDYNKYYGLDFTILRYGTPYGPGANDYNSVHRFLKQALEEKKIKYPGTGNEVREYIHAHDAAVLSIKALDEKYKNERIVLTGAHPIKVSDFLMMINEIFGNSIKIEYTESTKNVQDTHYQITPYSYSPKIAKKLVSESYLDLGQGLLDCIESIKKENVRIGK